jgi:hypothetical protein
MASNAVQTFGKKKVRMHDYIFHVVEKGILSRQRQQSHTLEKGKVSFV